MNIRELDDVLWKSEYGLPRVGNFDRIWAEMKKDKNILKEAIEVEKDKFGEKDIVKGLAISEAILLDYEDIDNEVYQTLVNSVYNSTDIARIVIDGASNGGYSFLLISLWNHNLKLTEEQKAFAVDEAMNKIGTIRWDQHRNELSCQLDKMGITDDEITALDIDGCINPIGRKSGSMYINYMFSRLSDRQAHGQGVFDIRYAILRNPNWTLEEKQKLIMDFWSDDETYDETLEQWEWGIINDHANYQGNPDPCLDKDELYDYTYDNLLEFYGDKKTADKIWQEIQFCNQMHELRPQQWEVEFKVKRKSL